MEYSLQPKPRIAAILMTYQCTAECDECCFSCSPHLTGSSLTFDKIKSFLDQISQIPSIKVAVFSGGECFINFSLLKKSVQYAHELGLMTRCVTNGFWGKTRETAQKKIAQLKECGLTEINFSTGDSHQQYVPVENILNCVIESINHDLMTCVAVETNSSKKFKVEDFIQHTLYTKNISNNPKAKLLKVMPTVWVSFHTDTVYEFDDTQIADDDGCEGIFDTIALESRKDIVGCCGITSNDIEEMHLGKVTDNNLKEILSLHHNDFLKIWIFVDGPKKIIEQVAEWTDLATPKFAHKCLYCAYLYNNPDVLESIKLNYLTIQGEVVQKYLEKIALFNNLSEVN